VKGEGLMFLKIKLNVTLYEVLMESMGVYYIIKRRVISPVDSVPANLGALWKSYFCFNFHCAVLEVSAWPGLREW
jgi:hypothetical protein